MQKLLLNFVLLVIFFSLGNSKIAAQYKDFTRIGVADGLSQSSVLSIHRDNFGFMWFGTRDGLNMYDAYSFTTYKPLLYDSTSLGGNTINAIESDQNGDLWLAHNGGLSKFNRATQKFKRYPTPTSVSGSNELRFVSMINGDVYAIGWSGLYVVDTIENRLVRPVFGELSPQIIAESASALYLDQNGLFWLATTRRGLIIFNRDGVILQHYHKDADPPYQLAVNRVEAVHFDREGNAFVGTYGAGVYKIDRSGQISFQWHEEGKDALTNNDVRCLSSDREGKIWIGTLNGINVIDPLENKLQRMPEPYTSKDDGRQFSVRSLFCDPTGTMWVGTYHEGIALYNPLLFRFSFFGDVNQDDVDPAHAVISAFAEDHEGYIYAVSERGGLDILNPLTGTLEHVSLRGNGKENLLVKSMHYDPKLGLIMGTFKAGMYVYDRNRKSLREIKWNSPGIAEIINNDIINCIAPSRDGEYFWLASDRNGGLHLADIERGELEPIDFSDTLYKCINKAPVKNIMQDKLGNLWLATKGSGVIAFHPRLGVFYQDRRNEVQDCNHLMEDSKGQIWMSTNGYGLQIFNANLKEFRALTTREGILNNTVLGSYADASGNIWMGLLNGITRVDPSLRQVKNYDYSRGFPLFELNEGAVYATASNRILFGGKRGWCLLNPESLSENEFKAPVVITSIKVMNKDIREIEAYSKTALPNIKKLQLDYDQNVITFVFSALNYINPSNNKYEYKLEGFDKEWISAGVKRDITYTSLLEGDYVFKVRGSNNDGVWNEEELTIELQILPPPWRTWWAFIFYALFIGTGIFLIRSNALRSARLKENLRLGVLEKERIEENHRLKLQFFTDVSHEIRTPLTLIVNPLEDLLKQDSLSDEIRKPLKTMRYNIRRLLLLVNQLLELRKIEIGKQELDLQAVNLSNLLGRICDAYRGMADKTGIKLHYHADLVHEPVMVDVDKLEKVLLNLLSNAFKFTPEGGEVSLTAKSVSTGEEQHCVITVSDTGEGITHEDKERIFERFFKGGDGRKQGTGIGLSLTKSLVNLMGGEINLESEVGKGSKFFVELVLVNAPNEEIIYDANNQLELPPEYIVPVREDNLELGGDTEASNQQVILIVEDNEELRRYMVQKLAKSYIVYHADSAEAAYEIIDRKLPDLIISDVMLPGLDGIEFCRKIKEDMSTSHLPIIMVTARQSDESRLQGLKFGADDYLIKPFMMEELEARAANILQMRQKLRLRYLNEGEFASELVPGLPNHDRQLLDKLNQLIEERIEAPNLNVEQLSADLGLSRVHLYRKLKALTDLSPSNYIRHYRLRKAEAMIRESSYRISEVAYKVGFQDLNYFGKSFKKLYGLSPTEYRENVLNLKPNEKP